MSESVDNLRKSLEAAAAPYQCKRHITHIVIHCTAGPPQQSLQSIEAHWRKLGWKRPGYHVVIDAAGNSHDLADINDVVNGARGHNAHGIHIAYIGGKNGEDTRTPQQALAIAGAIRYYHHLFPEARICGHRDLSPDLNGDGRISRSEWIKQCPSFDVAEYYGYIFNK